MKSFIDSHSISNTDNIALCKLQLLVSIEQSRKVQSPAEYSRLDPIISCCSYELSLHLCFMAYATCDSADA